MTNPIEELKERLEATKRLRESVEHQAVPPWINRYHEMEKIAEQFKNLAECYREIAIRIDSNLNALNDGYSPQEPVDRIASELFQGKIK